MVKISDLKPRRVVSLYEAGTASNSGLASLGSSSASTARSGFSQKKSKRQYRIFDDPAVIEGYDSVPLIDVDPLPRGGISLETKAVGRIQVGGPSRRFCSRGDTSLNHIAVPTLPSSE